MLSLLLFQMLLYVTSSFNVKVGMAIADKSAADGIVNGKRIKEF